MLSKIKSFLKHSVPEFLGHPLWRKQRLSPFLRFARLQLIFALGEKKVYLKWIDDLMLPIEKGDTGLTGNYYLGLHEFEDMAFAIHLLRENDLFVDVGANLGSYSLIASGVIKARSLAYEPVPNTYERLIQNISVNSLLDRVSPFMIALTSPLNSEGGRKLRFSSDRGCMNSFVDESYSGSTIDVATSTLDEQCGKSEPVLIKIDVEGFEADVLRGASQILVKESLLAVIIEGQTDEVNQFFKDAGFTDVNYCPLSKTIQPHSKKTSNRIWIKSSKYDAVKNRLKNASVHSVYGNTF
jgi:FkbM family methyltransferase